jgi:hypothetical protein
MLIAISFVMFALLLASWLVVPDGSTETIAAKPAEKTAPESGAMPARA